MKSILIMIWLLKISGGQTYSFALSLYSQVVMAVTAGKVSLEPEAFRDQKVYVY